MIEIRVDSDYESDIHTAGAETAFTPFDRKEQNVELIEVVVLSDTPAEQPISEKSLTTRSAKGEGISHQVTK